MPGIKKRYRGMKGKPRDATRQASSSSSSNAPEQGRSRTLPPRPRQGYNFRKEQSSWQAIERLLKDAQQDESASQHTHLETRTLHLRTRNICSQSSILRFKRYTRASRHMPQALELTATASKPASQHIPADAYMTSGDFCSWLAGVWRGLESKKPRISCTSSKTYVSSEPRSPLRHLPYIHSRVLSWPDHSKKLNNQDDFADGPYRDIFSSLWKGKKSSDGSSSLQPHTWIGLFSTWCWSWVGVAQEQDWHVWGAAVISNGQRGRHSGKHLLIWDCDAEPTAMEGQRPQQALLGAQSQLFEALRKDYSIYTLWVGGGELEGRPTFGQNKCVSWTKKWVKQIAHFPDRPICGINDCRLRGFVQLQAPSGKAR